jgi:hypothetical protein
MKTLGGGTILRSGTLTAIESLQYARLAGRGAGRLTSLGPAAG